MIALFDVANTLAPSSPTLPTSAGVAIACGYLMHALKKLKQIPRINFYSTRLNLAVRAITSFAATIGVNISWSGGTHTLTISNITLAVILSGLYHWFVQFGMQHGFEGLLQSMAISTYRAEQEGNAPKLS